MVKRGKADTDLYLSTYPHLHEWLNTCITCGRRGHKPDLPENIYRHYSLAARHLRAMLQPLPLSEDGMCDVCIKALEKTR